MTTTLSFVLRDSLLLLRLSSDSSSAFSDEPKFSPLISGSVFLVPEEMAFASGALVFRSMFTFAFIDLDLTLKGISSEAFSLPASLPMYIFLNSFTLLRLLLRPGFRVSAVFPAKFAESLLDEVT